MAGTNSGLILTIVNRTNSRTIHLPVTTVNWKMIMDSISDLEGYAVDDRPKWVKSAEYTTPTGRVVAEFTNSSDNFIVVVNGHYD
jgi:hypothetical protein